MATTDGFHPEALLEYAEAIHRYLQDASVQVVDRFATAVESVVGSVLAAPARWKSLFALIASGWVRLEGDNRASAQSCGRRRAGRGIY